MEEISLKGWWENYLYWQDLSMKRSQKKRENEGEAVTEMEVCSVFSSCAVCAERKHNSI